MIINYNLVVSIKWYWQKVVFFIFLLLPISFYNCSERPCSDCTNIQILVDGKEISHKGVVDFGTIKNGSEGLKMFTLKNIGDKPLQFIHRDDSEYMRLTPYPTFSLESTEVQSYEDIIVATVSGVSSIKPQESKEYNFYFKPEENKAFIGKFTIKNKSLEDYKDNKYWFTVKGIGESNLDNPKIVTAGYKHSCALDTNKVLCWGEDDYGQTEVPVLEDPVMLSSGYKHSCTIDNTGVQCWGFNNYGQTNIPILTNPYEISLGGIHSCVIDDGGVMCWGDNEYGQLNVPILNNPNNLSSGFEHSCVLDNTGVVCWGSNKYKQLDVPVLENPRQVSAGDSHTCALDDTGVVCWGAGKTIGADPHYGQSLPPLLSNVKKIVSGAYHSCAIDDTDVVCWGAGKTIGDNPHYGQSIVPELQNPIAISAGDQRQLKMAVDDN